MSEQTKRVSTGGIPLLRVQDSLLVYPLALSVLLLIVSVVVPRAAPIAPAPVAVTAATIAPTDAAGRTRRLVQLVEGDYGNAGTGGSAAWYPHIRRYALDGDALMVDTDWDAATVAGDFGTQQTVQIMATRIVRDLQSAGDPVQRVTVRDRRGAVLLALP